MPNSTDDPEDEDDRMPNFKCRLLIPDEFPTGTRLLYEQVDLLRQEIAYCLSRVMRATNIARRVEVTCRKNEAAIALLVRAYWMALGGIFVIGLLVKFLK